MAAIRVMIGDMPLLLRSLVEGILDEDPRFDVMRASEEGEFASSSVEDFDVLVVSEPAMTQILPHSETLRERGRLGIVAIAPDGLDAAVVRINAHRQELGAGSRQSLSRAILASAGIGQRAT